MDKLTTVVTERGQVSIPASLRKELGLKTGQPLVWEKNFRSRVFGESSTEKGTAGRNGDAWICRTIPR
jgi:looped-hinge helix DNA binding domain, AbrB family